MPAATTDNVREGGLAYWKTGECVVTVVKVGQSYDPNEVVIRCQARGNRTTSRSILATPEDIAIYVNEHGTDYVARLAASDLAKQRGVSEASVWQEINHINYVNETASYNTRLCFLVPLCQHTFAGTTCTRAADHDGRHSDTLRAV